MPDQPPSDPIAATAPLTTAVKPPKTKKKARLKIAHQVPGRIRMKIPSAKGNPERLEEYKETLSLLPGIDQIEVRPESGSIILKYDPNRHDTFHAGFHDHLHEHHGHHPRPPTNEIDALANRIEQEAEYLAQHSQSARAFVDFCKKCDREIKLSTSNALDLKMLLAIGVVAITIFEVGATAATPVWVTLSLFGMNHFIEMQEQRAAEAAEASAGASRPA